MKRLIFILAATLSVALSAAPSEPTAADDSVINIDFPDESREIVLRNIAEVYALNLVISESVPGRVSLKIKDRNWRELFTEILGPVGFAWKEERGVVRVFDTLPTRRADELTLVQRDDRYATILLACVIAVALACLLSLALNVVLLRNLTRLKHAIVQGMPNQPPEPTAMSVTSPAAQEPRQP